MLLLRRGAFTRRRARSTAAAASASATRRLLQFAGCCWLRFLLRRTLLLRTRLLRTLPAWLLLLLWLRLRTFSVALPLLLAIASRTLLPLALARAPAALVPAAARLAGALLVFADLLLHEPPRLLVQADAQLVMTAIGAALPPFGIGLFAT